ncbi:MAG: glycerol-3-phosphate 1-O-acyltransferase PlsY [Lentisphaerae bacterium]|nr:glycerol-3-phosphate 1-O-acyltransferase PlsY [Lentisphaerota bacterium]MBQ9803259.1 glycerol-3-phosphate 1-O-acyltransferase PlsY [Lentisphaeria bacterium]
MKSIVFVVFAYLCGSVPWGFIIGKVCGVDVRTVGSKNIGATNVTRCVGKRAGQLCFALDFLKGLVPVLIAQRAGLDEKVLLIVVIATVIGHMFPVFLNFKGGKGVSTAAGAIAALAPIALAAALTVWVVVFLVSRYVSLASITAAAVLASVSWVTVLTGQLSWPKAALMTVVAALAIFRHRENITRLMNGTENRFGKK